VQGGKFCNDADYRKTLKHLRTGVYFMLKQIAKEKVLVVAVVGFLLSITPIIIAGMYARPSWDDYSFSALSSFSQSEYNPKGYYISRSVRYAVDNGNILDVFMAVGRTVSDNYRNWQGTFSAIALFSVHPAVLFGANAYPLTMLFTIFSLIVSTAVLCKTILRENWLLLCILMLVGSIQWIPHIGQGFLWYNGAVFYTFFYSLMLLNLASQIKLIKYGIFAFHKVALITLFSFFIGGGNFVTALLSVEISVLLLAYVVYRNKEDLKDKLKSWLPFVFFALASLAGLIISMAAPGNSTRADLAGTEVSFGSIISTIMYSIGLATYDIFAWTTPAILLLLIAAVPIMWRIVKGMSFDFRYPLIVTIVSFLLFASQNAPPIFAMSNSGDARLRNIVYFSYILLIYGNSLYWLGWISKHVDFRVPLAKFAPLAVGCWVLLFVFAGVGIELNPRERNIEFIRENAPAALTTIHDLQQGIPQGFLAEHRQRQYLLENSTEVFVTVPAFRYLLFGHTEGKLIHLYSHWLNRSVAAYYGVPFAIGLPPETTIASFSIESFTTLYGRNVYVDSYRIADMQFFRLRDMAYLLQDMFNVGYYNGTFAIYTNQEYVPVGGELRVSPWEGRWYSAQLHSPTLLIDGIKRNVPSYVIRGEIFHRQDFFSWLEPVNISINGIMQNLDFPPKLIDGRTMLPLGAIGEIFGLCVSFDHFTNTATFSSSGRTITHVIHTSEVTTNYEVLFFDMYSAIIVGRPWIPLRMLAGALGVDLEWDADTNSIFIVGEF